ncbi:MAG: hypothetical protein IKM06_06290, partial [Clostridia bacterium]|nr:hypothetical protein [Clostridia bacterium]
PEETATATGTATAAGTPQVTANAKTEAPASVPSNAPSLTPVPLTESNKFPFIPVIIASTVIIGGAITVIAIKKKRK